MMHPTCPQATILELLEVEYLFVVFYSYFLKKGFIINGTRGLRFTNFDRGFVSFNSILFGSSGDTRQQGCAEREEVFLLAVVTLKKNF